ncbi:hypothetical protein DFH11DRAFT_1515202 [Phellopilus nigrolimitatus]|nr:hypothetical protein DFH11DRAFT_1515202 [Phellopilus nigrolimitatus]
MFSYGRGRGRPVRGRSYIASSTPLRPNSDPMVMDGLRPSPIKELKVPEALPDHKGIEPKGLKPLASYNWTDEKSPTILVPGCPPIWQNKPTPFKVPRDDGTSFVDQNRHRVPKHPLLPLVVAVDYLNPTFDFSSIDIVTDRNNLRKLLRWVGDGIERDFRIDLQLAGASTVLFTRCDLQPLEFDSGRLGYGRNFEKYTTKLLAGCEKSTGHHRVITYDYGGLTLMLRFEVDACLHFDSETQTRQDSGLYKRPIKSVDPDDLASALENLSIGPDNKVNVIPAGILVAQSSLIEMTTRNGKHLQNGIDWQEYFPQLFISQTPHHYLGVHESGQFRRVEAHALKDDVLSGQQRTQQKAYDKLRALLEKIREMVIARGEKGRLSLVYRIATRKLEVFERESMASCLPDSWLSRFDLPAETSKEVNAKVVGGYLDNPLQLTQATTSEFSAREPTSTSAPAVAQPLPSPASVTQATLTPVQHAAPSTSKTWANLAEANSKKLGPVFTPLDSEQESGDGPSNDSESDG